MARSKSLKATRTANFKNLSSEVLRLRLQSFNLPITGSRASLVERLRLATNSAAAAIPGHSRGHAQNGRVHKEKPLTSNAHIRPHSQPNVPTEQAADTETRSSDEDEQSDMDSAVEELFEDFEQQVPKDAVFSPTQMLAIQETVLTSVNKALWVFNNHEAQASFPNDLCTPGPRMPNTSTPLGLHCPLEKRLEDKILCREYIDFCLLLPDFMHRSQAPALQLRYEDSSPGSQGSPLALVRRKKPVTDTSKMARRFYCLHAGDCRCPSHACLRVAQIPTN